MKDHQSLLLSKLLHAILRPLGQCHGCDSPVPCALSGVFSSWSQVIASFCGPIVFVSEWAKRFRPLWSHLSGQMWMWVGTSSWRWEAKGFFRDLFHCRYDVQLGFCVYPLFSWYLDTVCGVRIFSWIKWCVAEVQRECFGCFLWSVWEIICVCCQWYLSESSGDGSYGTAMFEVCNLSLKLISILIWSITIPYPSQ